MSKVARPQQCGCQLYTGRAAFLSVAAVMTFISVCVADPSEFRKEVAPQAQGFVEESMLRVSSDVFQLALRNYAPLPEGNSSASAQMQVSQFVWRATMESCHSVPYIMLSTHLDFDRMLMLDDLAEGFLGCISAAVLIKSPNELSGLFEALDASKVRNSIFSVLTSCIQFSTFAGSTPVGEPACGSGPRGRCEQGRAAQPVSLQHHAKRSSHLAYKCSHGY